MRFTFIKETAEEGRYHFSQQAKDLALAKLKGFRTSSELKEGFNKYKSSPPAPPATRQHTFAGGGGTYTSTASRFNYKDYMKSLNERLQMGAPNSGHLAGS